MESETHSSPPAEEQRSASPPAHHRNKVKCKYCKRLVFGDHQDRKRHSEECDKRREYYDLNKQQQGEAHPRSKSAEPNESHKGSNSKDTCIVCGKVFIIGTHDVEECKIKKGGSLYAKERRRTKEEVQSAIQKRKDLGLDPNPYKFAKSVTPNLSEFDRKIKHLCKKKLPPIRPRSPGQEWTNCEHCGKQLTRSYLIEHQQNVCVVLGIESKFLQLADLLVQRMEENEKREKEEQAQQQQKDSELAGQVSSGDNEAGEDLHLDRTNVDHEAPAPSGNFGEDGNSQRKKKSVTFSNSAQVAGTVKSASQKRREHESSKGPKNPNRVLNDLGRDDAMVEECLRLVAVIDAATPITDLFLSSVSHLTPVVDPSLEQIEAALPTIRSRLEAWKDEIRSGGDPDYNNKRSTTSPAAPSGGITPQTQDLLPLNESELAHGLAPQFSFIRSPAPTRQKRQQGDFNGTATRSVASSSVTGASTLATSQNTLLPKLSGLLHVPRLHLREADEKKVIPAAGKRTLELAQSKTAKALGGNGRSPSPKQRASRNRSSEETNEEEDVEESDASPPRFDPTVLKIAEAIMSGQLTMSEALYPEKHQKVERRSVSPPLNSKYSRQDE